MLSVVADFHQVSCSTYDVRQAWQDKSFLQMDSCVHRTTPQVMNRADLLFAILVCQLAVLSRKPRYAPRFRESGLHLPLHGRVSQGLMFILARVILEAMAAGFIQTS